MASKRQRPVEALIVAVPDTAGSALYGMLDVLSAAGNIWQALGKKNPIPPSIGPWRHLTSPDEARSIQSA